jgi:hypothetical protein
VERAFNEREGHRALSTFEHYRAILETDEKAVDENPKRSSGVIRQKGLALSNFSIQQSWSQRNQNRSAQQKSSVRLNRERGA